MYALHPCYYSRPVQRSHPLEVDLAGQPMIPATLLAGYQLCSAAQLILPPCPAVTPSGRRATWPAHDTSYPASRLPGMYCTPATTHTPPCYRTLGRRGYLASP